MKYFIILNFILFVSLGQKMRSNLCQKKCVEKNNGFGDQNFAPQCSKAAGSSMNLMKEVPIEVREYILDYHNTLRANLAHGLVVPEISASNMNELNWSSKLELLSQCWLRQCTNFKCVYNESIFQNFNIMQTDLQFDSIKNFRLSLRKWSKSRIFKNNYWHIYPTDKTPTNFAQFTQMVWATTTEVGCSYMDYPFKSKFQIVLACSYKPAGNKPGKEIFQIGEPASKCGKLYKPSAEYAGLCARNFEIIPASKIVQGENVTFLKMIVDGVSVESFEVGDEGFKVRDSILKKLNL